MSQCPVCTHEIQDSFGLVECPSCHKILFADFDGTLKVHEEGEVAVSTEDGIPTYELKEELTHSAGFNNEWNLVSETPAPPLDTLDPVIEAEGFTATENEVAESEMLDSKTPEKPKAVPKAKVKEESGIIDSINNFANSDASNLKQGILIYNLTISNIDTEELKDEILDILSENKLNIDIKRLSFALPTLELKDLNPVKASVIVSKIKHLPVNVEWAQKSAITNEESSVE